jgi:rubredoxin
LRSDLGLASDPITGANDWTTVDLDFTTPQARAIRVAFVRRPSQKFDNKIDGSATIQSVTLVPAQ